MRRSTVTAAVLSLIPALWLPTDLLAAPSVTVVHRNDDQRPSYVRVQDLTLPGLGVIAKDQAQTSARLLKQFAAPVYGLDEQAQQALGDAQRQNLRGGASYYLWQQAFDDVPVFQGRLRALVDGNQKVRVLTGSVAQSAPVAHHSLSAQSAEQQLQPALAAIGLPKQTPSLAPHGAHQWRWQADDAALGNNDKPQLSNVRVQAIYAHDSKQDLVPAWQYEIRLAHGLRNTLWQLVVSENGELLSKRSLTRNAAYSYRVYGDSSSALPYPHRPFDGPFGDQTPRLATDPAPTVYIAQNNLLIDNLSVDQNDPWLPDNTTVLSGNHADVYLDVSGGDGFSGGADRRVSTSSAGQFHYSFDGNQDVRSSTNNQNAAMVQAFYVSNWLHDFFYDAGFVEIEGTAQLSNYGRTNASLENDRLLIEVQDFDGTNNANISVPVDGGSPVMQVFLFDGPTTHSVTVSGALNASYANGRASFGPGNFDQTGQLVLMRDGVAPNETDGCETLTNAAELAGRIALVDRGNCNFIDKVNRAQQAGALAVLVANNTTGTLTMGLPDGTQPTITIGSLLVSLADAAAIKAAMANGVVNATLTRTTATPIDGALDSALVAHEWGHYLNNRLIIIGDGSQANGMDEGWADFVAMLALSRPSDASALTGAYGFSGYATNDFYNGLRRFPYSADLDINGLSFRHISNGIHLPNGSAGTNNSEVHNTGEVWASALWDAYLLLLQQHGFAEAQDRMRHYLVAGQIATTENPDFLQARTAQLDAVAAINPADVTLFQQAFAKRGMGINAVAPSKANAEQTGVVESFVWTTTDVPNVNAGADQNVLANDLVTLNASVSDSDPIASVRWRQLSGPTVTLNSTIDQTVQFTAPTVTATTALVFEFTATDAAMERATDQVTINVLLSPNSVPTANAGADQAVDENTTVTLTGTGTDSDGTIAAYRWTQTSGTTVTLATPNAASTTFTAPTVNADALLTFQLTVTDNVGNTANDTVAVTVRNVGLTPPPPTSGGGGGGGGGSMALTLPLLLLLLKHRRGKRQD